MNLEFKPISAKDIDRLTPFYMMRRNKTCDSVFLESFLWREYYNVRYAIWEDRALLWLMEYKGRVFSAMPLCREEDLKEAFHALEQYFNEELGYPLVINLADPSGAGAVLQGLSGKGRGGGRRLYLFRRGSENSFRKEASQKEKPFERF